MHLKHTPKIVLSGLVAAVLVAASAIPASAAGGSPERPRDPAPPRTAAFSSTLQTDIVIAEDSMPSDFVADSTGTTGYVTTLWSKSLYVVDLTTGTVTDSIPLPSNGSSDIALSPDGTRAYIVLSNGYWSQGLAEIDLTTMTVARTFDAPFAEITRTALAGDDALFVLGLGGEVAKLDPHTGTVLNQTSTGGINLHGLTLSLDGKLLYASGQPGLFTYSSADLSLVRSTTTPGFSDTSDLAFDGDPTRLYASDSAGSAVGVLDPATGSTRASAAVGPMMSDVVGDDALDRAFSAAPNWSMVMAADLDAGIRSESYRTTPDPVFELTDNPVTGDLLASNGGWHNAGGPGSTVSIIHRPSVTDPQDATATTLGEVVTFHTDATGIKAHLGGIQWQSSTDSGTTWTDLEGETGNDLAVTVDAQSAHTDYRVSWSDDFWGASGVSKTARIAVPDPAITTEGPLADGTVGTEYEPTTLTAEGQNDLSWSATGVPDGLSLEPADSRAAAPSAVLTGTPTTAGTFTIDVAVTDSFGTDSHEYTVTVAEAATVPPTSPTPAPTDPTDPTDPIEPLPVDPELPNQPNPDNPNPEGGAHLASTGASALIPAAIAGILLALGTVLARRRRNRA